MRKLFKDYLTEIAKEDLYDYYETENHSVKECCAHFGVSQSTLMHILRHYGIHKSKDGHMANIKKTKLARYGDENYNNEEKRKCTNKSKYGVENQFQRTELFPEIKEKKIRLYGSCNNIEKNRETRIANSGSIKQSYKKQYEAYTETCLEKYGVENAATLPEVKNKIKDTLKETFMERYGAESYFNLENAKRSVGSRDSGPNRKFMALLDETGIKYEQEFPLGGKWYDFKVDNTLIEIDPTPTHNAEWGVYGGPKENDYHAKKTEIAIDNGYSCIHIFDWDDRRKILANLRQKKRLYARQCSVHEIPPEEAAAFLNNYHLQGTARSKIRYGLYYGNMLVSIMTFGKPRYNNNYEYELIRYCNSDRYIVGGAEKMFKHFQKDYGPTSVISYCDLSKFSGHIYSKLEFKKMRVSAPSAHWYNMRTKQHITDNLLRTKGFDKLFGTDYGKGTSNEALMLSAGFVRVYDCGQATYAYIPSEG